MCNTAETPGGTLLFILRGRSEGHRPKLVEWCSKVFLQPFPRSELYQNRSGRTITGKARQQRLSLYVPFNNIQICILFFRTTRHCSLDPFPTATRKHLTAIIDVEVQTALTFLSAMIIQPFVVGWHSLTVPSGRSPQNQLVFYTLNQLHVFVLLNQIRT